MPQIDANRAATIVALYAGGATQEDIAAVSGGISRARVGAILNYNGVTGRRGRPNRSLDPFRVIAACRKPDVSSWCMAAREVGALNIRASFRQVAEELGLAPAIDRLFRWRRKRQRQVARETRRAQLIEEYSHLAARLGRVPTSKDLMAENGVPIWTSFYEHFDSLRELREAAGIDTTDRRKGNGNGRLVYCKRGHLLATNRGKRGGCIPCRRLRRKSYYDQKRKAVS